VDRACVQELVRLKLKDKRLPEGRAVAIREFGRFSADGRLGMLAHERRSSRHERRVGQAYRTADHREPSARRVVDVIDRAALAQVRVGQHLSARLAENTVASRSFLF